MRNPNNLPLSACVLISRPDGLILSVSRKNDAAQRGLPGGKPEPEDDSLAATASRECHEETGLVVGGMRMLYEGDDGFGFWCSAFLAGWANGVARNTGQGHVEWVSEEEICTNSPFAEFNARTIKEWKRVVLGIDS